jgi:hypothetical protein
MGDQRFKKDIQPHASIDLRFLIRLWRLSRLLLFSKHMARPDSNGGNISHKLRDIIERNAVFLFFCLLIGTSIAREWISYYAGLIPSWFYEVLSKRDKGGYANILFIACGIFAAVAIVSSESDIVCDL